MKHSEQLLSEARRQHTEAIVARHMHQLFQRLPMLSGFWLRPDLQLAELSVFAWPGGTRASAEVRSAGLVHRRSSSPSTRSAFGLPRDVGSVAGF